LRAGRAAALNIEDWIGERREKFMFPHPGFENPTPEIRAALRERFESIADRQIEQGGFKGGREISLSPAFGFMN
jgi:hypothetical protein